jgi:CysZ protein
MLRTIGLALTDLGDRRILAIMLQALGLALLVFVLLGGSMFWLLAGSDPCSLAGMGTCWLDTDSSALGAVALTLLGVWFLFPAVAIAVIATFTDRIAAAVEQRHYPDAARESRPIGIAKGALLGLRSASRLILFNLIASPFYLLLLITGLGPFILFVIVNGLAFGRDVAELAASRHGERSSRRAWLKSTRGEQGLIGTVVSLLFLVPFVNLAAPIIGTAAGIHLFNRSFWPMNGNPDSPAAQSGHLGVIDEH